DPRTNPANNAPVGTGPFRFVKWEKGQYILAERNDKYWDQGKPYLEKVIFRIIPDPSARAVALERGDADPGGPVATPSRRPAPPRRPTPADARAAGLRHDLGDDVLGIQHARSDLSRREGPARVRACHQQGPAGRCCVAGFGHAGDGTDLRKAHAILFGQRATVRVFCQEGGSAAGRGWFQARRRWRAHARDARRGALRRELSAVGGVCSAGAAADRRGCVAAQPGYTDVLPTRVDVQRVSIESLRDLQRTRPEHWRPAHLLEQEYSQGRAVH